MLNKPQRVSKHSRAVNAIHVHSRKLQIICFFKVSEEERERKRKREGEGEGAKLERDGREASDFFSPRGFPFLRILF
jgi:hypothetical protein